MSIGTHLLAWRRHQGLTQAELAVKASLTRPYISRLEKGSVDPTLSSLQRVAAALAIGIGALVDEFPPAPTLSRHELDQLARAVIEPGRKATTYSAEARVLGRLYKERRRALGLYRPRKTTRTISHEGAHAARWLRASLGENQWKAVLNRIDKLSSIHAEPQ